MGTQRPTLRALRHTTEGLVLTMEHLEECRADRKSGRTPYECHLGDRDLTWDQVEYNLLHTLRGRVEEMCGHVGFEYSPKETA